MLVLKTETYSEATDIIRNTVEMMTFCICKISSVRSTRWTKKTTPSWPGARGNTQSTPPQPAPPNTHHPAQFTAWMLGATPATSGASTCPRFQITFLPPLHSKLQPFWGLLPQANIRLFSKDIVILELILVFNHLIHIKLCCRFC